MFICAIMHFVTMPQCELTVRSDPINALKHEGCTKLYILLGSAGLGRAADIQNIPERQTNYFNLGSRISPELKI